MTELTLTETVRERLAERAALETLRNDFKRAEADALARIAAHDRRLRLDELGIDIAKVKFAETFLYVHGQYERAGEARDVARQQAIRWFATQKPLRDPYDDLRREYFGTKSYDRWHGQSCNCSYGMGPRHGSIIFEIGLTKEARQRDLSAEETDAAIYYLVNLERIQSAAKAPA